jgi:uncharacterized protein (DUF4415 family)/uncharacterized DUF497 family protein
MRFEWDECKREANVAKRGLDFRRAVQVFDRPSFTYLSLRQHEERWVTVGKAHGRLVAAEELRAMIARGEDQTDWARVDAMTEAELEAGIASDPDWADVPRDGYKHAASPHPEALRKQVRLRLDPDLLAWFKRQGPGYQARINVALRAFVEAHRRAGRE